MFDNLKNSDKITCEFDNSTNSHIITCELISISTKKNVPEPKPDLEKFLPSPIFGFVWQCSTATFNNDNNDAQDQGQVLVLHQGK